MKKVYGVSSDHAHDFKKWHLQASNPDRGWMMVKSDRLIPDAIKNAMVNGNFYASSGVQPSKVNINQEIYEVTVDTTATYQASKSPYIIVYKSIEIKDVFWIEFISDGNKVSKSEYEISSSLKVPGTVKYLRATITFSRVRSNSSEQFFARTQPIFLSNVKTE